MTHLEEQLGDMVRILVLAEMRGTTEQETGQVEDTVLVQVAQLLSCVDLQGDSPHKYFKFFRVVSGP